MMLNFKKNIVVGVSVTPEIGLEVAQVDFATKTVLKYATRPLAYDNARQEIADLDLFKESLQDLLIELQIPKGSEIVINLPTAFFKVADYPASLNEEQILMAIEEDLISHPLFQNSEAAIHAVILPNSTIQFNKLACIAAHKTMLIEIALQIKELGYKLIGIDTSVNSTLNALMYNERINTEPDFSWVMLLVENNCCRIISMLGKNYVDSFEEKVSIGEVLGDQENYSTVIEAVAPILKNLPSQCLYIVSKTNIISAKELAGRLTYNAPIIHQEANVFSEVPFLETSLDIEQDFATKISLDVIGAAIIRDFRSETTAHLNLYNESLGDVYILEQPYVLKWGTLRFVLSIENMIVASIIMSAIIIALIIIIMIPLGTTIKNKEIDLANIEKDITKIQQFLKENKDISSEQFDEGDEIKMGLAYNKGIYSYYTIVGTEIPQKLWLTKLELGKYITIDGQADNLESVYSFFRNIKDYNPEANIKLQKLGLATKSKLKALNDKEVFDTESIISSMNADFYEFRISNKPEEEEEENENKNEKNKNGKSKVKNLSELEPID